MKRLTILAVIALLACGTALAEGATPLKIDAANHSDSTAILTCDLYPLWCLET